MDKNMSSPALSFPLSKPSQKTKDELIKKITFKMERRRKNKLRELSLAVIEKGHPLGVVSTQIHSHTQIRLHMCPLTLQGLGESL